MNTPIIDDILATHDQGFEFRGWVDMGKLANELRALLAERDRLVGEVTEWEGHAQTYEAGMVAARRELAALKAPAPRRLREYVASGGQHYRCRDGALQFKQSSQAPWVAVGSVYVNDVPALADLMANPEEPQPVETLESIIEPALTAMYELGWDRHGGSSDMAAEDLAKKIRAWLATQQGDNENSYPSPKDMACTGKIIRDEFIKAITPEQAVAVLVEKGAKRSTAWNSVIATGGGNDAVLILPTATPESGK